MADRWDADAINHSVDLVGLVNRYVPLTKNGREWKACCIFHDEQTPSLTVYEKGGEWQVHCFGCGAHYNAITFLRAVENLSFNDACEKLTNGGGNGAHPIAQPLKKAPPRITTKPPQDCLPPPFATKQGEPSRIYYYLDADRESLGFAAQYGDKLAYWTWGSRSEADPPKWEKKPFSHPSPLYGLEQLAAKPHAQVLVCHDERAAEAAITLFPTMAVIAWPGGDHAQTEADWTPITGRDKPVILLPRNDPAGEQCMARLAVHLYTLGIPLIKGINPDTYEQDGAVIEAPQGWSIADAPEGLDGLAWAKARVRVYPAPEGMPPPNADPIPHGDSPPSVEIPHTEIAQNAPEHDMSDVPPVETYGDEIPPPVEPAPLDSSPPQTDASSVAPKTQIKPLSGWKAFGYSLTDKGAPIMSLDNAIRALEHDNSLLKHVWYDQFLDAIVTDWNGPMRQWADVDDVALCAYMQRYLGLTRLSVFQAHDAALMAAFHNPKNECKDWLNALAWDGTERLPYLLSEGFGAAHNAYTQAVGRCWMVSMVARVMRPGCKVDTVPVLEGEQGTFKSSALHVLGGKWFIEAHESVMTKDFFGVLNGHMIVEISEMHSFTRAEVERIKGVISCQVDRYRKAYGRNTEDHPRHTVLVCTTNRDDWQRDDTGARRFWPVRCGYVTLDWLTDNREQLFAEAVHRYRQREKWWDVPEVEQRQEVENRREIDSWEKPVLEFIHSRKSATIGQILDECLNIETAKQDIIIQRRVGKILRVNGWHATTIRASDGSPRRAWVRCGTIGL